MKGKFVFVFLLLIFFVVEKASSAAVQNGNKSLEEGADPGTTTVLPLVDQTNATKEKAEDIYGKLTGIANKLKKESCRCVSLFDECGVEMLEETVIKVRGKPCLTNQRYCCGKEEIKMNVEEESNLKKLMQSSKIEDALDYQDYKEDEMIQGDKEDQNLANSILRDEISNMSINNETLKKELDNEDSYIKPSTLGAILRLFTEGFKFMSNFF